MITKKKNATLRAFALLAVAMLAFAPAIGCLDASEGRVLHVTIHAGDSFIYDDIAMPMDGGELNYYTAEGPMAQYISIHGKSLSGTIPATLAAGDYDCILVAHGTTASKMTIRFHVLPADTSYSAMDQADAPKIVEAKVMKLGNSTREIMVQVSAENTDTVSIDYNDGIVTPQIAVGSNPVMSAHTYQEKGAYMIGVTATNEYGSVHTILMYDSSYGSEPTEPEQGGFDWKLVIPVIIVLLIVIVIARRFI